MLPEKLQERIERICHELPEKELAKYAHRLSESYRSNQALGSERGALLAYLAVRAPATYAVIHAVLSEVKERIEGMSLQSFFDAGAGPSMGFWAVSQLFEGISVFALMERERGFIEIGKQLTAEYNPRWIQGDLTKDSPFPQADLVLHSYVLNEIAVHKRPQLLEKLWQACGRVLVLIEPGTSAGFLRILEARKLLLEKGAHMVAPCPHEGRCPLLDGDWCHFSRRLERSSIHRRVKGAELGYEDEKYSYVVFAKERVQMIPERLLRPPKVETNRVHLTLCTPQGLQLRTVVKSDKKTFREAKKMRW